MKRSSALFLVLGVLVVGFLVGIVATHLFYAQKFRKAGSVGSMASDFFAHRLERDLNLDTSQREQIDAILEETREAADELRFEIRPRIALLMEDAAERIDAVLTEEQRARFEELRERHRGRSEHFFLGPPRRGPKGRGPPWRDRRRPASPPQEAPPPGK